MDDRLQAAPIGVLVVSSDGTLAECNDAARELIDADGDLTGVAVVDVVPHSVEDSLLSALEGASVAETSFEEYYPSIERWLAVSVVPAETGATVYVQDVSARRRAERTVEELRAEHRRTAIVDETRSAVLRELVATSSRAEIEETLARELGERDLWTFAWVGERTHESDGGLTVQSVVGTTGETFQAVREAVDGSETTPEGRAVEQARVQVAQPIAEDSTVPKSVQLAAFGDGVQSMLAIPLSYGSTVDGVVGVYADRPDAFSERERASFETLGQVAGFAVTAARNRKLLLSDTVTEVTFSVEGDSPLRTVASILETTLTLGGLVPHESDAILCYVTPEESSLDAVTDAAVDIPDVGHGRVLPESGAVEIELRGSTPLLAVSSLGGTVRRASYGPDGGQFVVDLPPESDARQIVSAVRSEYDVEVRAKHDRERSVTTAREFRDELSDRLTDRQETVLHTAYLADYFQSPRGSTAEEVADSLDITGSTLLYHLRASQRKLLATFFRD